MVICLSATELDRGAKGYTINRPSVKGRQPSCPRSAPDKITMHFSVSPQSILIFTASGTRIYRCSGNQKLLQQIKYFCIVGANFLAFRSLELVLQETWRIEICYCCGRVADYQKHRSRLKTQPSFISLLISHRVQRAAPTPPYMNLVHNFLVVDIYIIWR